ncbi:helix-turn-helix domain-containing protein [Rhizobium lusitanum]|uniref:helix-turn-helix domain-containing protein n=1 Tax=Rhizobium lusitanum TaxID=293958 RepID=UPI00195971D8|nr:XRE family transcriptional regulator [Rhizobium lusitanum]MBM7049267.1 helix-turn-helix transcriptional regulator [Rhizobium lusitanum]
MTGMMMVAETEQQLGSVLACRIQSLRHERLLSLDALAKLTGLSKGTVVALEKGKANPSIGVLCRLAAAFSLSVSDLLSNPANDASGSPIERTKPKVLWTSPKGSQAQLQVSTSGPTMFELWSWTIMPGDEFRADGHSPGTRELISVAEGSLKIRVGAETLILSAGEGARLVTDQEHSYAAAGDLPARFSMAVLERGGSADETVFLEN